MSATVEATLTTFVRFLRHANDFEFEAAMHSHNTDICVHKKFGVACSQSQGEFGNKLGGKVARTAGGDSPLIVGPICASRHQPGTQNAVVQPGGERGPHHLRHRRRQLRAACAAQGRRQGRGRLGTSLFIACHMRASFTHKEAPLHRIVGFVRIMKL